MKALLLIGFLFSSFVWADCAEDFETYVNEGKIYNQLWQIKDLHQNSYIPGTNLAYQESYDNDSGYWWTFADEVGDTQKYDFEAILKDAAGRTYFHQIVVEQADARSDVDAGCEIVVRSVWGESNAGPLNDKILNTRYLIISNFMSPSVSLLPADYKHSSSETSDEDYGE
jgi:hypothetical protein